LVKADLISIFKMLFRVCSRNFHQSSLPGNKNLKSHRDKSSYITMLNPNSHNLTREIETGMKNPNNISVVLLTQNAVKPMFQAPHQVLLAVPKGIFRELIVVHYNTGRRIGDFDKAIESTDSDDQYQEEQILHVKVQGEFATGVMEGIELSNGRYILVMDADVPYPRKIIPELITALISNPNSIIVASRYVKDAHIRQLPFLRNTLGKTARLITKYGLKIKNVKDPMSGCFAFSRYVVKDLKFEGKGSEALLEILVKTSNDGENRITVKEIPIKQIDTLLTRNIDFNRILNYSMDVWELYKHGKRSKLVGETNFTEQKTRRTKVFLSKAGRFFTVGASGLIVNYVASFLLSSLVPNIWYMYGTLFGIILSITSNFLLNKLWTFEDKSFSPRHFFKQYALFMALCALGAFIQLSLIYVFVETSNVPYAISLILAVCIASIGNFLLNKKITFGEKIWG